MSEEVSGVEVLDVPSGEISQMDALKSDDAFMEKYLSGDKVAVAQMGEAITNDQGIDQPSVDQGTEPVAVEGVQVNFGAAAQDLSMESLVQLNQDANEIIGSLQVPSELVQPFYDHVMSIGKEYGADPERGAEARRAVLHEELQHQWGSDYESKMDKVVATLNAHPELDEFLYSSGAWADPWTISTLARVVEGSL